MKTLDAQEVIENVLAKMGAPLTDSQKVVMAGALAVCIERAVSDERKRCADIAESWPNYRVVTYSIGPRIAKAIRE